MDQILAQEDIRLLVGDGRYGPAAEALAELHPADAASVVESLGLEGAVAVLGALDPQGAADLFCQLYGGLQAEVAERMEPRLLKRIASRLSPDDRADLLNSLPDEAGERLLSLLSRDERAEAELLASYPEGSAGALMTSRFLALPYDIAVVDAMARIRREAPRKESVYTSYIVDGDRRLIGLARLRDLIMADPHAPLADIMDDRVHSVRADEGREAAVFALSHYDLLDLPVVDAEGRVVGIITHDDAMDAMEEAHTEDMERFMAIAGSHDDAGYLQTGVLTHFKHRVGWLVALAAVGLASGAIMQGFEDLLTNLMILALYLPMLADTGGNTGSQSATVVVRALALKEISAADALRVLAKELGVALLLGLVLGILAAGRVLLFTRGAELPFGMRVFDLALAVSLALSLQVVSSTVIGAALPLAAAKLKIDPALVASPMLATVVDITGLLLYFSIAKVLLGGFLG